MEDTGNGSLAELRRMLFRKTPSVRALQLLFSCVEYQCIPW
jgi:hypothetical protein